MTQKAANNTCTHAFYPLISRCVRPDRVNPSIVIARSADLVLVIMTKGVFRFDDF